MNELYHHGVKGMKWGVRAESLKSSKKINTRKDEFVLKKKEYIFIDLHTMLRMPIGTDMHLPHLK